MKFCTDRFDNEAGERRETGGGEGPESPKIYQITPAGKYERRSIRSVGHSASVRYPHASRKGKIHFLRGSVRPTYRFARPMLVLLEDAAVAVAVDVCYRLLRGSATFASRIATAGLQGIKVALTISPPPRLVRTQRFTSTIHNFRMRVRLLTFFIPYFLLFWHSISRQWRNSKWQSKLKIFSHRILFHNNNNIIAFVVSFSSSLQFYRKSKKKILKILVILYLNKNLYEW